MANERLGPLLRLLRRHTGEPVGAALSDGQLLDRFVRQRDEAAFEALFWRHGPMVLGLCRRLLPAADAEDAFQATFLVLVRKASSIGRRDALGAWLYRVAYRVALRARATTRHGVALPDEGPPAPGDEEAVAWRDLRPLLDEAIGTLPEKYRAPIVLCYLEGKTNEEAARELGCPKGTVAVRLMRARERLRRHLSRRRLALPAVLLGAVLGGAARSAPVHVGLGQTTLKAVLSGTAGASIAGAASVHATALAEGVIRAMYLRKMKLTAAFVVALGVLVGGGIWWQQHAATAAPPLPKDEPARPAPGRTAPAEDKDERHKLVDVASAREGILLLLGIEVQVKPGEKPPPGAIKQEMASLVIEATPDDLEKGQKKPPEDWVRIGDKWYRPLGKRDELKPNAVRIHHSERWFVPLKEGDLVKAGQLIALTDPGIAVDELGIKLARYDAAEAARAAEEKQRDEYRERWQRADLLSKRGSGSLEDATAAKLAYDYHVYETLHMQQDLKVAGMEVKLARTLVEMHQVRSRIDGVVRRIYRYAGEGAKAMDAIVQIRAEEK
jgi:RNA polymerase sigma factor (sigma-70 family)